MSDEAHIIEIDRIVLTGVDPRRHGSLTALIEAEVVRALRGSGLSAAAGVVNSESAVAIETAGTVMQAIKGGSNAV